MSMSVHAMAESPLQQQAKGEDFGYYIKIPRLLRTGYETLSALQKWIYICLKDLCGDFGICFRSLRILAKEVAVSTGLLSESIRTLHQAGLIIAEKKPRSAGGKAIWHISIVDIWSSNAKEHPTAKEQRSSGEQLVPSPTENVHCVNDSVSAGTGCSAGEQDCSADEHGCSPAETEGLPFEGLPFEGLSGYGGGYAAYADIPTAHTPSDIISVDDIASPADEPTLLTSSALLNLAFAERHVLEYFGYILQPLTDQEWNCTPPGGQETCLVTRQWIIEQASTLKTPAPGTPPRRSRKKPAAETTPAPPVDLLASASPAVQAIVNEWRSIFRKPIAVTVKLIEAATRLADFEPDPGEIVACREWMYQTDRNGWYRTKGMALGDVARDFERFRSLKDAPSSSSDTSVGAAAAPQESTRRRSISSFDDPTYDMRDEFYPSEYERTQRDKAAQQSEPQQEEAF